jgi:hypothetical protein
LFDDIDRQRFQPGGLYFQYVNQGAGRSGRRPDLYSMQVIRLQGCSRMRLGIAVGSANYFDSDFAFTEVADFDFSDPPIRSKMPDNLELITR